MIQQTYETWQRCGFIRWYVCTPYSRQPASCGRDAAVTADWYTGELVANQFRATRAWVLTRFIDGTEAVIYTAE